MMHTFLLISVILLHLYSLAVGMRLGVVASSGEARPVPTACGMNSRRPAPVANVLLKPDSQVARISAFQPLGHVHNQAERS